MPIRGKKWMKYKLNPEVKAVYLRIGTSSHDAEVMIEKSGVTCGWIQLTENQGKQLKKIFENMSESKEEIRIRW